MSNKKKDDKPFSVFRLVSPLLFCILGLFGVVILAFVFSIIGVLTSINLFNIVSDFLFSNMLLIFIISVMSSYADYFFRLKSSMSVIAPTMAAIAGTIIVIFISRLMAAINVELGIDAIDMILSFLDSATFLVFLILLIVGYVGYIADAMRR